MRIMYCNKKGEEEEMATVKCQIEVLNKLIEQFEDHARWAEADGNVTLASFYIGLAEGLRRVRNGDFE